ncbi:MAG: class I SAM-dependent methyltransferase [Sedimentisphaerales bacterium]|nr:class I SAM-dependent methyltransferase [Sedimentisphaerales bacterium]
MHQVTDRKTTPDYIREYLAHLGMEDRYRIQTIPCEICGFEECTIIREIIDLGKDGFGRLPVAACNRCGYLFQNPRFERRFYDDYYSRHYRDVVCGNSRPSQEFIDDQIRRGRILRKSLTDYLPKTGRLLDVGCSSGGMMVPFLEAGWQVFGTDPDVGYVQHGKEQLGLPLEAVSAEDMTLEPQTYDLIMIMGSLEHVFDPNRTLQLCRRATKPQGLLLLEGRGNPQGHSRKYFNHNHHRYFSLTSFELIMIKYGWEPVFSTQEPICGPTRPGAIYCLGRAGDMAGMDPLLRAIEQGKRENPEGLLARFDQIDRDFEAAHPDGFQ